MLAYILLALVAVTTAETWNKDMENSGLYEGDIVLDPDEKEASFGKWNGYASIKGGRWPGAKIPYAFDGSWGDKSSVTAAINDYHKYTCLRFHPRTNERSYLYFKNGGGCSSPVGYRYGRRNDVTLASGCRRKGTVMHEIGHSIGLYHEQSRPDRDQFVTILWNNIYQNNKFNFNKQNAQNIDSLGTPYDYRSMMHYGSTAFGISRRMTIQTTDRNMQNVIGNRNGFSAIDIEQINKMYCGGTGGVKPPPPSNCKDDNSNCSYWQQRGECNKNPNYMLKNCRKSCRVC